MRFHTIFCAAGLLPATAYAHLLVHHSSGGAHHPGVPVRGCSKPHGHNTTHAMLPGNATANASPIETEQLQPTSFSTGLPPKQSANVTGIYTSSYDVSAAGETHGPYTKSTGAIFVNSTATYVGPSGTGVSGGFAMPTAAGTGIPMMTGTGASSGFAHPTATALQSLQPSNSTTSGRAPFTKSNGYHIANSTSIAAGVTGTGFAQPSGTGSSGLVRPTGFPTASGYFSYSKPSVTQTNSTSSMVPLPSGILSTGVPYSVVTSTIISTATVMPIQSGHLPYSQSTRFVFSNSTIALPATGTGVSSLVPLVTAPLSTGVYSTGLSAPVAPSGSAPPYSKPTTPLFVNSTTIIAPTGSATGILTTGSSPATATISASSFITASAYPIPTTLVTRASTTGSVASTDLPVAYPGPASPSNVVFAEWDRCGGIGFEGNGVCVESAVCKNWNPYYSQCVPKRYL